MNVEDLFGPSGKGMPEDDNAKPSPLESLKADLDLYKDAIREVSVALRDEGYTTYPIFVAHQHEVSLGEIILDRAELGTSWTIHASSLEEFVERGIIQEDRKDYFINKFKPADEFMCLFVVVPQGANFVFYPFV